MTAPAFAKPIAMRVSETCGYSTDYLEIVIWNPPGGTVLLEEDGTFTVDVPEGTKLAPDWNGDPNLHPIPMGGPWTPAQDGGVLPVFCTRRAH